MKEILDFLLKFEKQITNILFTVKVNDSGQIIKAHLYVDQVEKDFDIDGCGMTTDLKTTDEFVLNDAVEIIKLQHELFFSDFSTRIKTRLDLMWGRRRW